MASVTEQPQSEHPPAERGAEQLVDRQIRSTRRALKLVDLSAGLITLAIGVLVFLLTVAVLEHWVVPGGWGETGRLLLFGVLLVGVGWYSWRTFWPLMRQTINPMYAAQAIEQSSPSLKNSLLNLLLLRGHKRELPRQVFQAIEQQAEQRLSQVRLEAVVDRSAVLRLGYILVAVVALCALYRFLSPKDLFSSAGRVLAPWASIAVPSRVEILDVTPGDTQAARGEQLKVTAEVLGLEKDEPVRLFYSTADEQIVGQEIPMSASAGGSRFQCRLPGRVGLGSGGGIQHDFTYWIEAGDSRSPRYRVGVFARPTLVVSRVRYEYPAYTGYPSRDVEHTGDVRAVEGTRVTVFATANKPIKTAHVDFEADGRNDLLMNASDREATVTFPLEMREDRRTPRHQSYMLRYVTAEGNQNQSPPKYQIDVVPDYSPEIQLLLPEEAVLDVALNQEVNFELEARDPDFALRQVVLLGKVGEEQVVKEVLLSKDHTGRFVGKLRKTPAELGLKVGDVLEYWGAAADIRRPEPNLAYSAHRKIRVTGPWQGNQDGAEGEQQEGDQKQEPGEGEPQEGEGGQEGQAGAGEQGNSSESEEEGDEGEGGAAQESGEQGENSEQQGKGGAGNEEGENSDSEGGGERDSTDGGSEDSSSQDGEEGEADDDSAGGDSAGGEGGEQEKVSPEGDDDGSAFERMAEHFDDKAGDQGESASEGEAAEGEQQNQDDGRKQEGEQAAGQEGEQQERSGEGEGAEGEPAAGEEEAAGKEEDSGEGEQPQQEQNGDSLDENMSPEQGDAGAGESAGDEQGTPDPAGAKSPQEKQDGEGEQSGQESQEAPSKGSDQAESDSEGDQGGDRTGGGQKGAGQQADEDGTGAAGENQAADDGAGQAQEPGEGEASQPGDKQQAEGETGESSEDQPGEGSKQSEQAGDQAGGEAASEGASGEQQQQQGTEQSEGQPSEASGTGGKGSPPPPGETMPGDEANLDFAKKKTDLILDRLEDQLNKKQVDKSLLEKLGWTQDELQRFVDRWKNLKSGVNDPNSPEAKQELDAALRSLGLSRKGRTGFGSKITKDKLRDLQDAYRGRTPLEYQEQVRAYIKGTATGEGE